MRLYFAHVGLENFGRRFTAQCAQLSWRKRDIDAARQWPHGIDSTIVYFGKQKRTYQVPAPVTVMVDALIACLPGSFVQPGKKLAQPAVGPQLFGDDRRLGPGNEVKKLTARRAATLAAFYIPIVRLDFCQILVEATVGIFENGAHVISYRNHKVLSI